MLGDPASSVSIDDVIPHLDNFVAIIDVTSDVVVKVALKSTNDLPLLDLDGNEHLLFLNIIKSDELISLVFRVLDSSEYDQNLPRVVDTKVQDLRSDISILIDIAHLVTSEQRVDEENLTVFYLFVIEFNLGGLHEEDLVVAKVVQVGCAACD